MDHFPQKSQREMSPSVKMAQISMAERTSALAIDMSRANSHPYKVAIKAGKFTQARVSAVAM